MVDRSELVPIDETNPTRPGLSRGELVVAPGSANTLVLPPGQIAQEAGAQTTGDFTRAAADTASFGLSPRVGAMYQAAAGNQPSYEKALDAQLKELQDARTRSPYATTMGDVTGSLVGGGGLIGAGRLGIRGTAQAGNWLSRIGRGATEGTVVGGLEGAGHTYSKTNDPTDYLANFGFGGTIGAAAGGITAPLLGAGAGQVARRLPGTANNELPDTLVRAAQTDEAGLRALIARGNPRESLLGGGPSMMGTAQGAYPGGTGPGRAALFDTLTRRNFSSAQNIAGETTNIFGPAPRLSAIEEGLETSRKSLSPHYDRVLNGPNVRAVDTEPIANWLQTVAINDRGDRQAAARELRARLDITGTPGTLDPNPATLQSNRSAIRNTLRNEKGTLTSAERTLLEEADQRMTAELQAKVPGIQRIDDQYAEVMSRIKGVQIKGPGFQALNKGDEAITPDDFRDMLRDAARPKGSAGASMEPEAIRTGLRAKLENVIGNNKNDLAALDSLLGEPHDWNMQKLAHAFGQDRADRLVEVLRVEKAVKNEHKKVIEDAQTAQRLAAMKAQEATGGATNIGQTAYNRLEQGLGWLYNKAIGAHAENVRDRIAGIMAADNPTAVRAAAERLLETGAARDRREAVARVLMQSGFTGGTAGVIPKNTALQRQGRY